MTTKPQTKNVLFVAWLDKDGVERCEPSDWFIALSPEEKADAKRLAGEPVE